MQTIYGLRYYSDPFPGNNNPCNLAIITPTRELGVTNNDEFRIIPNPILDNLRLKIDYSGTSRLSNLRIYDLQGRMVKSYANLRFNEVDLPDLIRGVYFIVARNEQGEKYSAKLMKM